MFTARSRVKILADSPLKKDPKLFPSFHPSLVLVEFSLFQTVMAGEIYPLNKYPHLTDSICRRSPSISPTPKHVMADPRCYRIDNKENEREKNHQFQILFPLLGLQTARPRAEKKSETGDLYNGPAENG